ncbi:hypothetical protein A2Z33_04025 [Candidatus Gottesmanbacteria bacterium RBG_16_52_11]|uniref:Uncharacterized protein n=1 Tax=Candidatus Gottesmanbacteria bacterium RBG_16_52_11 TaxID=1798374 RepID=A0A1F5YVR4_9BACT|nr:MAG: hypothetical protein A2Z33_04025 [Candidatus Gottesmanbacteria bacterium RBG_16_52_11]
MNIDRLIIIQAITSSAAMMALQTFVMSGKYKQAILRSLMAAFGYATICHYLISAAVLAYLLNSGPVPDLLPLYAYPVISFILFGLVCFSVVLTVFGLTVTSLRIHILTEIADAGEPGIAETALEKKYSKREVMVVRLIRLTESGELVNRGRRYFPVYHRSYFLLHTFILMLYNRLYNLPGYARYWKSVGAKLLTGK